MLAQDEENTRATAKFISNLTIIDAEVILNSGLIASQNQNKPTPITDIGVLNQAIFMVCAGSRGLLGEPRANNLHFKAKVGDLVSFEGITASGNSDTAVIIYGFEQVSGKVFKNLTQNRRNLPMAVQANINAETPDGLPADYVARTFCSLGASIAKKGKADIHFNFALYDLSENGRTQELIGYYQFTSAITVE